MACLSHSRLLKRGGFTPLQFLFGREPEPPEGEPLDLDKDGLDITNFMADRLLKQKAGYKAWIEAEAETEWREPPT